MSTRHRDAAVSAGPTEGCRFLGPPPPTPPPPPPPLSPGSMPPDLTGRRRGFYSPSSTFGVCLRTARRPLGQRRKQARSFRSPPPSRPRGSARFRVTGQQARVRWLANVSPPPPPSHWPSLRAGLRQGTPEEMPIRHGCWKGPNCSTSGAKRPDSMVTAAAGGWRAGDGAQTRLLMYLYIC